MIHEKFRYLPLKLAGFGMLIAAFSPHAFATAVTYSTTGVFSADDTSQTDEPGDPNSFVDYVSYTGSGTVNLDAPSPPAATVGSLGSIEVIDSEFTSLNANGTFTLTINQTTPPGTGNFGANTSAAVFSGSITRFGDTPATDDTLMLTFNETSVNIAGIEYTLTGLTGPQNNQLDLSLYSNPITVDIAQLPEPTLMALTGFGFAGLCFVAFRRRRSA